MSAGGFSSTPTSVETTVIRPWNALTLLNWQPEIDQDGIPALSDVFLSSRLRHRISTGASLWLTSASS